MDVTRINEKSPFIYNGKIYYGGTIISVKEEYKKYVGFYSTLKYVGYLMDEEVYCFSPTHDIWEIYKIPRDKVYHYIESVLAAGVIKDEEKKVDPKYINGIVSAWIWYLLGMFFFAFAKDVGAMITGWITLTFVFFRWRYLKIRGK